MHSSTIDWLPERMGGLSALMAFTPLRPRLQIYYIGQSGNVARRLDEHTNSPKPFLFGIHRYVSTYFAVARVDNTILRAAAEAALIRALKPIGNDNIPLTFRK